MTVELIYKCNDATEYADLKARFGETIPNGYTRLDDDSNLCMVLTLIDNVDVNS